MEVACSKCLALHWLNKKLDRSLKKEPLFGTYCSNGNVQLPKLSQLPPMVLELYTGDTPIAKHFRTHIRKYNSALAFTSFNYQLDKRTQGGLQCFQIHGALYHMAGPLEHPANCKPQFAQLFLYNPQEAVTQLQISEGGIPLPSESKVSLLQQLLTMLYECNPFIAIYRIAHERLQQAIITLPQEQLQILLNPKLELVLALGKYTISILLMTNINIYIRS